MVLVSQLFQLWDSNTTDPCNNSGTYKSQPVNHLCHLIWLMISCSFAVSCDMSTTYNAITRKSGLFVHALGEVKKLFLGSDIFVPP
jgi:hypothetical protein